MSKDAAITVRISADLKRRLLSRAKREHRSISAQVVQELERALIAEQPLGTTRRRGALGLFRGARLPRAGDFAQVRAALWGQLGQPDD